VAYFNLLASVSERDVERLRLDPSFLVRPSMVSGASHLLAYWVQAQPLGGLLGRALDGGELVHPELWHPLRPPLYHPSAVVAELAKSISEAWETTVQRHPLPDGDWLAVELARLLRVFNHGAEANECIISVLDKPADRERASRVRLPWPPQSDA
jgi:hypothetical protein